ncbi:hypothetical protein E5F05_04755 (plasmid) [Deinococcus metallilatus]|uniref:Uncharacterized protein n=1 Tax=Deinococcus metallilatus TaxID=1211322 RepID=A0AAJ5FB54_9DEIO|nr:MULTISPECIES: hypothetical protein [Deinococcus]MBB5293742.1 hypothetical protein [Deinococcus metallilatus]QBY07294.1 hypothetical protein E5F05_04755 [Deinococcus metallilatus]RXJ14767.1 hypothetical protein ERJ73_03480 [Deinococcus metallilatus]TLK30887.1 hypothetical protein FCS05_03795 [Deinococcus metallilatus]
MLLDAELPLLSCLGQWRDLLRLTGWEEDRLPGFPAGGFLPALLPEHLHCSSREQHLSLRVTAREVDGVTWVTLDASPTLPEQRAVRLACCQERWGPPVRLRVPSGTTVEPLGGGGSGGRWHHAAVLGAERTAAALFDHFSPQLAEQGWTEVSRTTDSPMSVGSWFRVRGGPGALLLFLELVEAKYDATLKVIRS